MPSSMPIVVITYVCMYVCKHGVWRRPPHKQASHCRMLREMALDSAAVDDNTHHVSPPVYANTHHAHAWRTDAKTCEGGGG
jgi:hypothetical protein